MRVARSPASSHIDRHPTDATRVDPDADWRQRRPFKFAAPASNYTHMEGAGPVAGQISCSLASTLIRLVRSRAGEGAGHSILEKARVEHPAGSLDDPSNWIWLDECIALLEAAAHVLDNPEIGLHVGE